MDNETTYQWETSQLSHLKFEVPTTWTNEAHGSNVLVVQDPKTHISIEFVFIAPGTGGALVNEKLLMGELSKRIDNLKVMKKPALLKQHGLTGLGAGGTGQRGDEAVEWFTVAIGDDKSSTGVVALGVAPAGEFHAHADIMRRTMDSIQPIAN